MKILFVDPPDMVPQYIYGSRHPALGPASLAGNLDGNHDPRILGLELFRKKPFEKLREILSNFAPDMVAVGCMTAKYYSAKKILKIAREEFNVKYTVIGGPHITIDLENIIKEQDIDFIDYFLRGEAEFSFNELVNNLEDHRDVSSISGLGYRENGDFYLNPFEVIKDLASVRPPRRDIYYYSNRYRRFTKRIASVETTRGCTNNCKFCQIPTLYGNRYRKIPINRVIDDLKQLKSSGVKDVLFTDDNVTLDRGKRLTKLLNAIIENKLNDLRYFFFAEIDGFSDNEALIKLSAKAGVKQYFLGIETCSEDQLKAMSPHKRKKGFETTKRIIDQMDKHGIITIGSFIFGYPDDKEEDIWNTYRYAREIGFDQIEPLVLTPFPKTPMYEHLKENNLITNTTDLSQYTMFHVNVRTRFLSSDRLRQLVRIISPVWYHKLPFKKKLKLARLAGPYTLVLLWIQLLRLPISIRTHLRAFAMKRKAQKSSPGSVNSEI